MHVLTICKNHLFMSLLFYLPSATSLTGTKFRLDCPCHVVCLTLEYHAQVYTAVFCKPGSYWAVMREINRLLWLQPPHDEQIITQRKLKHMEQHALPRCHFGAPRDPGALPPTLA